MKKILGCGLTDYVQGEGVCVNEGGGEVNVGQNEEDRFILLILRDKCSHPL